VHVDCSSTLLITVVKLRGELRALLDPILSVSFTPAAGRLAWLSVT